MDDDEWFEDFYQLPDSLTKCLVLVALLNQYELIHQKESGLIKNWLLEATDEKHDQIIATFLRKKSFY